MLLRRITQHVKNQNWFAVGLDFLIVVFGVYVGIWVGGYQERTALRTKQVRVVEALRLDMQHVHDLDLNFTQSIDQGFNLWEVKRARGEMPPPFYYRIPGSDTPPQYGWTTLPPNQMTDMFAPDLLFDLGFYYSELEGIGKRYQRYIVFVEDEVMPGLKQDSSFFYREDGMRLKPEFEANMDRLRDWASENARLQAWSACLVVRLETPLEPRDSCIPDLATPVVQQH